MAFVVEPEDDPEKKWLKVEVSGDHGDGETAPRFDIVAAPSALIGTAVESQYRVIQVCVGAEHGVLRTDAGIAFTWGDNRYGQLGRTLVYKEENNAPFPVLDLEGEEVIQVAAGKNHCLALTSSGHVKAWGRNKQGQLGIGGTRDKVEPKWVCLAPRDGEDEDRSERLGAITPGDVTNFIKKFGLDDVAARDLQGCSEEIQRAVVDRALTEARPASMNAWVKSTIKDMQAASGSSKNPDPRRIITIGAGGNSSIAAAVNSDVWQWGEISAEFKVDDGKEKKHKKTEATGEPVKKERPHLVACWKRQSFRTQMRKEKDKVSIRETLCLVLDDELSKKENKGRLQDLASDYLNWIDRIATERRSAKEWEEERRGRRAQDKGDAANEQDGERGDLQDTIGLLEREMDAVCREIDVFEKNIKACEQQQQHNRKQIELLTGQATHLTEAQGKYSQQMLEPKKSGQEKKKLEAQLGEIRDFLEANQNTKATLEDQRAENDKEKQRLSVDLQNKIRLKEELSKRRETVKILGNKTRTSSSASDPWVAFLSTEKEKMNERFEGKPLGVGVDILEAKKKLEKDEAYLRDVEARMNEMALRSQTARDSARAKDCKALLSDLVDLRRKLNDMTADKFIKEDLNKMEENFFKDAEPKGALAILG